MRARDTPDVRIYGVITAGYERSRRGRHLSGENRVPKAVSQYSLTNTRIVDSFARSRRPHVVLEFEGFRRRASKCWVRPVQLGQFHARFESGVIDGFRYSGAQVSSSWRVKADCHPAKNIGQALNADTDRSSLLCRRARRLSWKVGKVEDLVRVPDRYGCNTTEALQVKLIARQDESR